MAKYVAAGIPTGRIERRIGFSHPWLSSGLGSDRARGYKRTLLLHGHRLQSRHQTVENGSITNLAPRDSIKYIDAQIIGRGTPDIFLDKPWLAVDIPRGNSTCTVSVNQDGKTITQTVPAGPVYVTATAFVGTGANQFSTILFRRSLDCGVTWSVPVILSRNDELFGDAEHQGTMIAIDPSVPSTQPATIYVAWRRFANLNDPDDAPAIFVAKSAHGARHWAVPVPIVLFPMTCVKNPKGTGCPYDQDFTTASFRSNGYPAM